ncbi:MAG TPA: chemotaxis protein CheX [Spirochaetia bacterium]|nr:chemotaxis protein CheX [Spirochaetia bacterium]
MNVDYINPFLSSTIHLFSTMFGLEAQKTGDPYVEESLHKHRWDISGVMILTGNALGVVALRLSKVLANKLLEKSGIRYETEKDRRILVDDMVGELVNIIAGNAAQQLKDFDIKVSVPIVVQGQNHTISWPAKGHVLGVPFWTPLGPFLVNVSFSPSVTCG